MDVAAIFDRELGGTDPYLLMEHEAERIDGFASSLDPDGWRAPSACAGWSRHDLMAHLAGSEEYNHACLEDTIEALMARAGAAGVTDLHGFNQWTVDARRDVDHPALLREWRHAVRTTRQGLAGRDGGDIPTMVGPYPARRQAFHLAAELATHADDLRIPVSDAELPKRAGWRARATRFFLAEIHPEVTTEAVDGGTRVTVGDQVAVLPDPVLVAAANRRLPSSWALDPAIAEAVALM